MKIQNEMVIPMSKQVIEIKDLMAILKAQIREIKYTEDQAEDLRMELERIQNQHLKLEKEIAQNRNEVSRRVKKLKAEI